MVVRLECQALAILFTKCFTVITPSTVIKWEALQTITRHGEVLFGTVCVLIRLSRAVASGVQRLAVTNNDEINTSYPYLLQFHFLQTPYDTFQEHLCSSFEFQSSTWNPSI